MRNPQLIYLMLRLSAIAVLGSCILSGIAFAQLPNQNTPQERIWDHELKRWLNAEELGHMEIYFTEEEAAKVMFSDSETIRKEILSLTPRQKDFIEKTIGWKFPETSFTVFIGKTKGKIDGYAMVQNTIGKHRPMTYMVGVGPSGECMNFEGLVYREARGNEIYTPRFNYQYYGKNLLDPIRINRDILNITGATMSVRSASAGVKRTLVLVNEYYLKPKGLGINTVVTDIDEEGFLESILGL